jgi:hypothetical protein
MKTYGGWRYSSTILELDTRWRWVVSFTPRLLYSRGKVPCSHCIGGWVGPKACLDVVEKTKISCPCRNLTPAVQSVARRYIDRSIPAPPNDLDNIKNDWHLKYKLVSNVRQRLLHAESWAEMVCYWTQCSHSSKHFKCGVVWSVFAVHVFGALLIWQAPSMSDWYLWTTPL